MINAVSSGINGLVTDIVSVALDEQGYGQFNVNYHGPPDRPDAGTPFTMVWLPSKVLGRAQLPPNLAGYTCSGPIGVWRMVYAPSFAIGAQQTTTLTFVADQLTGVPTADWNFTYSATSVDPQSGDTIKADARVTLRFTIVSQPDGTPTMSVGGMIVQTSTQIPKGGGPASVIGPTTIPAAFLGGGGAVKSLPTLLPGLPDDVLKTHPDWQHPLRTESETAC